jgi:hypothetical protein
MEQLGSVQERATVELRSRGEIGATDESGFFVAPFEADAIAYAENKTRVRKLEGRIPDTAYPVVLTSPDSVIGQYLEDPPYPIGGEKFIPIKNFSRVPRDAFQRIPLPPGP